MGWTTAATSSPTVWARPFERKDPHTRAQQLRLSSLFGIIITRISQQARKQATAASASKCAPIRPQARLMIPVSLAPSLTPPLPPVYDDHDATTTTTTTLFFSIYICNIQQHFQRQRNLILPQPLFPQTPLSPLFFLSNPTTCRFGIP